MVKVSVIILFYKDIEVTEKCLQSVLKTDFDNFEIILVDNNSGDGSFEYFKKKYRNARVVHNKVNGWVTGGYNFGAKFARGEFLFFTNNDIVVGSDWLSNLVIDKNVLCQPVIYDYYNKNSVQNFGGRYIYPGFGRGMTREPKDSEVDFCQAEMLIYKTLFNKLGGFDERFKTNYEDTDLSLRAKRLGAKCIVCKKSRVYHMGSWTYKKEGLGDLITYHTHKNALLTIKNNFFGADRAIRLSVMMLFEIIYCGVLIMTLNFKKSGIIIKALRYV